MPKSSKPSPEFLATFLTIRHDVVDGYKIDI